MGIEKKSSHAAHSVGFAVRATRGFAVVVLSVALTLAPLAVAQSSKSSDIVTVKTRLITVDIVASDSHGNPVRDLKASDFQVFEEHSGQQKIARFQFIDRPAKPAAPSGTTQSPGSAHIYSNQIFDRLSVPPTVILVDALNTDFTAQLEARRHMLLLLKTLPPDTPVAVFLLTHTLSLVQTFTTDPSLLRSAVDGAMTTLPQVQNPQTDPDSPSNAVLDENEGTETPDSMALEDFEKIEYAEQMTVVVDQTAEAMETIAKYLGGYQGRKNLIWFSEAFPLWIEPGADFGTNSDAALASYTRQTFSGSAVYTDRVQAAAEALTDAQISVYPVDARGLQASGLYSATQNPHMTARRQGPSLADQMNREDTDRVSAQGSMQEIAEDTGGKTCSNSNDLSGCVATALQDSSSYYEIAYYPANARWDGSFRKITVKTTQHGVKLRYRRGYFAVDKLAPAREQPGKLLEQACAARLTATSIPLTASAVAPQVTPGQPTKTRYLLTISADALNTPAAAGAPALNLQVAMCEYDRKDDNFQVYAHDASRPASDPEYQARQTDSIRELLEFAAKPETQRLRFAVLDVSTGLTGSLDVPAHPRDFVELAADGAPSGENSTDTALLFTHLAFRVPSGESSSLDSDGSGLSYVGNLSADRGAPAFFNNIYGKGFHCQSGTLVANDSTSSGAPNFRFMFRNSTGLGVVIDLAGDQPAYSGTLPVDPSAKGFFEQVWKLCHCQGP